MKRPWDDEPSPRADKLEAHLLRFVYSDYTFGESKGVDLARNEEKRRRAAERAMDELLDAIVTGDRKNIVAKARVADQHLAAAREEDNQTTKEEK